jgi:hypothetical protein
MLLQSLLRPVLTPIMRGMFDAPVASSAAWSPLALWPDGIATPGMWISPRDADLAVAGLHRHHAWLRAGHGCGLKRIRWGWRWTFGRVRRC